MPSPVPLDPEPVAFETPCEDLPDNIVVRYTDGVVAVFRLNDPTPGTARWWRSGKADPTSYTWGNGADLAELAITAHNSHAEVAFELPEGKVITEINYASFGAHSAILLLAGTLASFSFLLPALQPWGSYLGWIIAISILALVIWRGLHVPLSLQIFQTTQGDYPFPTLLDDRPLADKADRLVSQVKESYGALLSDIVYRIESPALFDPVAEPTRAFTAALIEWDNNRSRLSPAELSTLAARIKLLFEAARAHAETVGIDHLPETARIPAGRAAKALRIATSHSASPAERSAALAKAAEIIESMMLYYLPSVSETRSLAGGNSPKELPGRHQ